MKIEDILQLYSVFMLLILGSNLYKLCFQLVNNNLISQLHRVAHKPNLAWNTEFWPRTTFQQRASISVATG